MMAIIMSVLLLDGCQGCQDHVVTAAAVFSCSSCCMIAVGRT